MKRVLIYVGVVIVLLSVAGVTLYYVNNKLTNNVLKNNGVNELLENSNVLSLDEINQKHLNAGYAVVDVDSDNKEDIIVSAGNETENRIFYFYRGFDDDRYILCGQLKAEDNILYKRDANPYVTVLSAKNNHETISYITFEDDKIKTDLMTEKDFNDNQEHTKYDGLIEFTIPQ